jgi:predicted RNase H-like nuclease
MGTNIDTILVRIRVVDNTLVSRSHFLSRVQHRHPPTTHFETVGLHKMLQN